jgi:pimeloyl-ACP methyl ester carboxylesterase
MQTTTPSDRQTPTQFYTWKNYRCAYEVWQPENPSDHDGTPLLLIHPIGVGLSRQFWQRFCQQWYDSRRRNPIYNPDLLGCGDSDMPTVAYQPSDWAQQLQYFIETVVKQPVILVVQGALFPVAISLVQLQSNDTNWIRGLALSGPPAWAVMTRSAPQWRQRLAWNFFNSPLGNGFYRYARSRKFLENFSVKELFEKSEDIDRQWLDMLVSGAQNPASRHAVFSFLSGFWRKDYSSAISQIVQPTLVLVGDYASSISQEGKSETPDRRVEEYLEHLPNGQGKKIPGRNVLPYESPSEFVEAIAPFVAEIQ